MAPSASFSTTLYSSGRTFTEPGIGIVWSLVLEGTALWLWYQRRIGTRFLGLCASLLLLAGPLHQVSAPLVAELERTTNGDTARVALIGELQSEVRSAEQSLTVANDNATAAPKWQRASWIPAIDRAQARAVTARGKLLDPHGRAPRGDARHDPAATRRGDHAGADARDFTARRDPGYHDVGARTREGQAYRTTDQKTRPGQTPHPEA